MKFRPSLLLAIAFVCFSMTSCIKTYTCHCVIKYSGAPGLPDSTIQEYTLKDQKDNAKDKCKKESATYNNSGIRTEENCYLY